MHFFSKLSHDIGPQLSIHAVNSLLSRRCLVRGPLELVTWSERWMHLFTDVVCSDLAVDFVQPDLAPLPTYGSRAVSLQWRKFRYGIFRFLAGA